MAIDYVSSPRYIGLARLLLEHGFNISEIYGDAITPDEAGSLEWFRENFPDIPFRSTANFRARFYDRNEAEKYGGHLLAIGPKAAYFTGTNHFVNMLVCYYFFLQRSVVQVIDRMTVHMTMSVFQSICYCQRRTGGHNDQSDDKHFRQPLVQKSQRKQRADKRRGGIKRARLRRSDNILRAYVSENTQSI